jgi:hypothetical protein
MRSLLFISQVAAILGSAGRPGHLSMIMFVSCECLRPETETTELYEMFNEGSFTYALYNWYVLDEETFIAQAREPAAAAHEAQLKKPVGADFKAYLESLSRRGMTPDQITTLLLKKYYKSLRSKTAMHRIAVEDAEYED